LREFKQKSSLASDVTVSRTDVAVLYYCLSVTFC
jgi:hypothetical protein